LPKEKFLHRTQEVEMPLSHGLGYLPDVPRVDDLTSDHPEITNLIQRTNAGQLVAGGGAPAALPAQVDLTQWFPPVFDQGSLGSCTANAAAGLLEYFEKRAFGKFTDASRLFIYKAERDLLGWTGDTGAYLRTAMEALVLFGAPPDKYWPYDGQPPATNPHYDVEPPAFLYAFGANFQAVRYYRHDPPGVAPDAVLAHLKAYAAAGFPSMFGFPVYSEYDNPLPGGLIAYPTPQSHYRGGHANVVAGYDDNIMIGQDQGALLVRNSWGTGWANAGYGWLSYKYVTQGLANDFWSMISARWVDTNQF
jgi:C1A family cysteine protease